MIYLTIKKYLSLDLADFFFFKKAKCVTVRDQKRWFKLSLMLLHVYTHRHTQIIRECIASTSKTQSGEQRETEREGDGKGPATESRIVGDRTK